MYMCMSACNAYMGFVCVNANVGAKAITGTKVWWL